MSYLIVKDGKGVWQVSLGRLLTIGRGRGNDLVLNSLYASRRHAWIWQQGNRFIIEDLGSTHGTYVNGQRLAAPRFLQHSDMITMGDATLFFVARVDAADRRTPSWGQLYPVAGRRFCPRCGAANLPTAQRCEHCGSPLPPAGPVIPEDHVPTTARPVTPQEPVVAWPFPPRQGDRPRRVRGPILFLAILAVVLLCAVGTLATYVLF